MLHALDHMDNAASDLYKHRPLTARPTAATSCRRFARSAAAAFCLLTASRLGPPSSHLPAHHPASSMDVDAAGGWGFCEPFAAEHEQLAAAGAVALDPTDLDVNDTASRALRVLLGAGCALPHSALRLAVLGSGAHAHSGSRRWAWGGGCTLSFKLAAVAASSLPPPPLPACPPSVPADVHACRPPTPPAASAC